MNRVAADLLQTFIDDVGRVVASTDDEHEITQRVAQRLSDPLAGGHRLPPELTRPSPMHHLTYPLYIAPDDSWSMASVVWEVGQPRSESDDGAPDRSSAPRRLDR
jgi:predicted metal-dependent enzyme (double-stranded beta helix superfamily)